MGDVLSQNEIDALLNALSSGELDVDEIKENGEKQVKDYDFARPSKFSKEHLRTLEIIFEHYGRLLSTNLPVYLRKNVQIEVMNSEAVTYQEFSNLNIATLEMYYTNQCFEGDQINLYKKKIDNKYIIEGKTNDKSIFHAVFILK